MKEEPSRCGERIYAIGEAAKLNAFFFQGLHQAFDCAPHLIALVSAWRRQGQITVIVLTIAIHPFKMYSYSIHKLEFCHA